MKNMRNSTCRRMRRAVARNPKKQYFCTGFVYIVKSKNSITHNKAIKSSLILINSISQNIGHIKIITTFVTSNTCN